MNQPGFRYPPVLRLNPRPVEYYIPRILEDYKRITAVADQLWADREVYYYLLQQKEITERELSEARQLLRQQEAETGMHAGTSLRDLQRRNERLYSVNYDERRFNFMSAIYCMTHDVYDWNPDYLARWRQDNNYEIGDKYAHILNDKFGGAMRMFARAQAKYREYLARIRQLVPLDELVAPPVEVASESEDGFEQKVDNPVVPAPSPGR